MRYADSFERELLSTCLDLSSVGLVVLDQNLEIVLINGAAAAQFDVTEEQAIGHSSTHLFACVQQSGLLMDWLFNGTPGGECNLEITHRTQVSVPSDLSTRYLLMKATGLSARGGDTYRVLSTIDVTKLRSHRERVAGWSRKWQAINAGVVISDACEIDMPIIYVNQKFQELCGYPQSEILGRNCRFLQGEDRNQPGLDDLRSAIANGRNGFARLRNYRKDGSLFVNELFISPLHDADGRIVSFLGIQHLLQPDVTEPS